MPRKLVKLVERKLQRDLSPKERKAGYILYGLSDGDERVIEVDPRQPERERLDTILHEVFHQLEDRFDLRLNEEEAEAYAEQAGSIAAQVLWKDGWRRVRLK